ncbi:MAG: ABC transporter substrate-binding protein [Coriobacteriales bacterium]|nr:ABC transporter substrate-binding protein [Coriobacteriales bacterium]
MFGTFHALQKHVRNCVLPVIALVVALAIASPALGATAPATAQDAGSKDAAAKTAPAATDAASTAKTPEKAKEVVNDPTGPAKIVDMTGREISLDAPATNIVALSAADCEILFAVGAGETLVGRGEYCDYPAEVLKVPSVQSGYETNIEQIIALEPQVLLMSTMAQTKEQVEELEAAGITVVVSDAQDIEGVYESVRMIGALTGHAGDAEKVVKDMQKDLEELAKLAKDNKGKTIYFEVSPLQYGLWAAGKGSFMNEVSELLGLENIFADMPAWAEVSEEQVIDRNPDYIVTISMYYGEGPTPIEEIMARPGWDVISAVEDGNIINLPNNELSRPTPRIAEGARMLADFIAAEDSAPVAKAA